MQGLRIYKEQLWIESICLVIAGIFGGGSLYAIKYLHCWMACHLGAWSLEVSYLAGLCRFNVHCIFYRAFGIMDQISLSFLCSCLYGAQEQNLM